LDVGRIGGGQKWEAAYRRFPILLSASPTEGVSLPATLARVPFTAANQFFGPQHLPVKRFVSSPAVRGPAFGDDPPLRRRISVPFILATRLAAAMVMAPRHWPQVTRRGAPGGNTQFQVVISLAHQPQEVEPAALKEPEIL
jgi:hypothetical protein